MKKIVSIILCLAFCLGMVTTNVFATNKQSVEDGLYTLKNVSSGYMLNVYAGKDANGTKVTTWKFDGTTDQQIYIQHQRNGKYLLQFKASSVGRVIDVNRGESLTAPLDNGDGIDIWTANDLDAQYFYINSCDDGSYTFELIAKPNHVISAVSSSAAASNGTQLQLKQFTDADYQKWYLCDLNGCIVQSKEDNGTQKCSHNITSKQLLSVERKAANEREYYHNVVETYSVKCEDCGIPLDNEKVFIQESHIDGFDEDDICTYCNEPIICAHQFTKEATNEEITPLNADQHLVNLEKYEYCSGCGDKLLIFESYTSGEPHNFKGNTCSDCGYEKCSHSKTYKVKKSSEVKQYDEQYHIRTESYDVNCTDCGTTIEQNKSVDTKEAHSGSTCSCGYTKPFQNKKAYVATTGNSSLILRTGPSTSYSEVCRMPRGSEITVTGEKQNGFYPLNFGSYSGYASAKYISFTKPEISSTNFLWPVKGSGRVTCVFQGYKGHNGVDIGGNPAGTSMPILASKAGTVSVVSTACSHDYAKSYNCGCAGGFGRYIKIDHGDGTSTTYAHLRSVNVSKGQYVEQGQQIAMMGTTGWSSGVHLHFEIRVNNTPQNPLNYIKY